MNKTEIYKAWAPAGGVWSRWVKPVLFACMDELPADTAQAAPWPEIGWVTGLPPKTALVLDLPGEQSVRLGLVLATLGLAPVPLFNAVPWPGPFYREMGGDFRAQGVVKLEPTMRALRLGAPLLTSAPPGPDAAPVFLLDANRRVGQPEARPGPNFDNRSVCFTTDFPSGLFLRSRGINRVMLVTAAGEPVQPDLSHTLLAWQEAGIALLRKRMDEAGDTVPLTLAKPSFFRLCCQRVLTAMGLPRNALGGFGGVIADGGGG